MTSLLAAFSLITTSAFAQGDVFSHNPGVSDPRARHGRMPAFTNGSQAPFVARFDFDIQRSEVLKPGKYHVQPTSAIARYADEFFKGRTNAIVVAFYTATIDDRTRGRLLENPRDDASLIGRGAAYLVLLLDKENRITQVNLTCSVPGVELARTVAYTEAEVARRFADYRYVNGRLHLKTEGTYIDGPELRDDRTVLTWNLEIDVPVTDIRGMKRRL